MSQNIGHSDGYLCANTLQQLDIDLPDVEEQNPKVRFTVTQPNAYPGGLFWITKSGSPVYQRVEELLEVGDDTDDSRSCAAVESMSLA